MKHKKQIPKVKTGWSFSEVKVKKTKEMNEQTIQRGSIM